MAGEKFQGKNRIFPAREKYADRLKEAILDCFHGLRPNPYKAPIYLCIGSDRSTGDSLGPLVGEKLTKLIPYPVYGTLTKPVHAQNIIETVSHIQRHHCGSFCVAVDACLGPLNLVGSIAVKRGLLFPGSGIEKQLPPVGDIHIVGIVNTGGFCEYLVLQNTRLGPVLRMATIIAAALTEATFHYFNIV